MSFYVKAVDESGKEVLVKVTLEVYEFLEQERKAEESYERSQRRHPVIASADSEIATHYATLHKASEQDIAITNIELERAVAIIKTCTETQQRRFYLNRICGYSLTEIAKKENCSVRSIKQSVDVVDKKIKK